MDAEFQQKMAIVSGANIPPRQIQKLTDAQKQNISKNYFKLFFALSMANWMAGNTLGASWHKAMAQMDAYSGAKNTNNPVAMYIKQIHVAHQAKWKQVMMTHKMRDAKLAIKPEQAKKWKEIVAKNIRMGIDGLNAELKKFQAPTPDKAPNAPVNMAEIQAKMRLAMMQSQHQRAA